MTRPSLASFSAIVQWIISLKAIYIQVTQCCLQAQFSVIQMSSEAFSEGARSRGMAGGGQGAFSRRLLLLAAMASLIVQSAGHADDQVSIFEY